MAFGSEKYQSSLMESSAREALLTEMEGRYPAEKPVCFNYSRAREDIYLLCALVRDLSSSSQNLM